MARLPVEIDPFPEIAPAEFNVVALSAVVAIDPFNTIREPL